MKYSVCIDSIFKGQPIEHAIKATKSAGFSDIEFWAWWDKDLNKIAQLQKEYKIGVRTFCTKYISLTDKDKRDEYIMGLSESINAAKVLGCDRLITQVGNDIPNITRNDQHKSIVDGLKACVPMLENAGTILMIEPLNTVKDHIGYYMDVADEAFEIVDEVGSSNVKVLYDLYHQEMMKDNDLDKLVLNIDKIAHFHAAGCPGRNEIIGSDTDYEYIFKVINNTGYSGHIGLEYFPIKDANQGLMTFVKRFDVDK